MLRRFTPHIWGVMFLVAVGALTCIPLLKRELIPGLLGTRFFGYGALLLLGLALIIGPLARLRPRPFARFVPYRRAMGIWSALSGIAHLLFVLQMVGHEFYRKTWLTLFVQRFPEFDAPGNAPIHYGLNLEPVGIVAWLGLIALSLLLLIALVSNDRLQRFLSAATWKLVQQWSYTAFLFVSLHLLTMQFGGKLKLSPALAGWALWFLLAVALLQAVGFGHTIWKRRSRQGGGEHVA